MLKKLDIKHVLHKKSIQIPLPGTFKSKRPLPGTFRSKDSTRGLSDQKTSPGVFQSKDCCLLPGAFGCMGQNKVGLAFKALSVISRPGTIKLFLRF